MRKPATDGSSCSGPSGSNGTLKARKRLVQIAFDRSHDAMIIADYRRKVLTMLLAGLVLSATLGFVIAKSGLEASLEYNDLQADLR